MYNIPAPYFNLDYTLDCGQVFRWNLEDEWWHGVVKGEIVHAFHDRENETLILDSKLPKDYLHTYFRLDDDLPFIFSDIDKDPYIHEAISKYSGMRLILQEPWECLISYMLATASNIPRIKKSIERMSRLLGDDLGDGFYSFPKPKSLASCYNEELCECKMGFRARRIVQAAQMVVDKEFDLTAPYEMDYADAKQYLMTIEGIGDKVADCVLLFAYDKMEAFPVDTHVEKIVRQYYSDSFKGPYAKAKMSKWGHSYFGKYCGYAQQYLFYQLRLEGALGTGI
ncbi:DNA glycosylase [Methanohalophilus sp.]|uniref:DNA-3-methyladenine glycosylase family protein n=1 Tax=Methanohalophilus sp. TaxID=1966352 RepID=UPI00262607DD|nr:DNA glycosylase [Methanohalophilus sp.]MDK2892108.1 N-glycosylase/DNA lyase [Methanohalophilus sp.]